MSILEKGLDHINITAVLPAFKENVAFENVVLNARRYLNTYGESERRRTAL